MKKSLILAALLFVASVCCVCYIADAVDAPKEDVEITQTTLYGDPKSAEGLAVMTDIQYDRRLFWLSEYHPGTEPEADTAFTFHQERQQRYEPDRHYGINLDLYTDVGIGGSVSLEDDELFGMTELFRDVASRARNGEEHSEQIRFKDYYEYYPMSVELTLPGGEVFYTAIGEMSVSESMNFQGGEISQMLSDYFRIRTPEDMMVEVWVKKDESGGIYELSMNTLDSGMYLNCCSVVTDTRCYFAINNRESDGEAADFSDVPGGYGIYCLPYTSDGETVNLALDELGVAYPIDMSAEFVELSSDPDGDMLLLTLEDGMYMLTVLDPGTAAEKQKLKLMPYDSEYGGLIGTWVKDGFIVVMGGNRVFSVAEKTPDGAYKYSFSGSFGDDDSIWNSIYSDAALCYDGERFAIAVPNERYVGCDFRLAVFDKTGMLYCGNYESSLDKGRLEDYGKNCRFADDNRNSGLSIAWED